MNCQTIKDKLVTILEELKGSGKLLKQVYGFQDPQTTDYPVAYIKSFNGMEKRRFDTNKDQVTYRFVIRVMIPITNNLAEQNKLCEIVDTVLAKFNESTYVDTLGGVCDFNNIVSADPFSEQGETPVTGIDFFIEASKLELHT